MDELFNLTDKALYRGKTKGRNCYIIYLKEKHAGINLKSDRDKTYSSMYLHSKIFKELTKDNNLDSNINSLLDFLGNYLMIDHLGIENDDKMLFDYIHPLCKYKTKPISNKLIETMMPSYTEFISENVVLNSNHLNEPLYKELINQHIYSIVIIRIAVYGKTYGYLRAEILGLDTGRIWQHLDLDLLISFCHILVLILSNKK